MTSFRWYLVDALIRWLLDNNCVPHVVIQCNMEGVSVPQHFVENHRIVLNVSPNAVRNYVLDETGIQMDTRFNGVSHHISAPQGAIIGVHAKGGKVGMTFEPEEDVPSEVKSGPKSTGPTKKPKFKFVE